MTATHHGIQMSIVTIVLWAFNNCLLGFPAYSLKIDFTATS
jgi:hypothetical protein